MAVFGITIPKIDILGIVMYHTNGPLFTEARLYFPLFFALLFRIFFTEFSVDYFVIGYTFLICFRC